MTTAVDVTGYIVTKVGSRDPMKALKLTYYAQVWHLVWHGRPLFSEKVRAWTYGPVVRESWKDYETLSELASAPRLTNVQRDTVDAVIRYYGDKSGLELSDMTHVEAPWREARKGIPNGALSSNEVTKASMMRWGVKEAICGRGPVYSGSRDEAPTADALERAIAKVEREHSPELEMLIYR